MAFKIFFLLFGLGQHCLIGVVVFSFVLVLLVDGNLLLHPLGVLIEVVVGDGLADVEKIQEVLLIDLVA